MGETAVATRTVTLEPSGIQFTVEEGETILTAARRQGVHLPYECGWGSCGKCKAQLISGTFAYLFSPPSITERDRARGRFSLCQAVPKSDLILRAHVQKQPEETLKTVDLLAECKEIRHVRPDLAYFYFEIDRPADFLPGQYAIFDFGQGLRRAYSMANLPGSRQLEFIIKRYSGKPGSETVFHVSPGNKIKIELPYGAAYLRWYKERPIVMVAGGTGIAPILSMLRFVEQSYLKEGSPIPHVHVIYGARDVSSLIGKEILSEIAKNVPNVDLSFVVDALSYTNVNTSMTIADISESALQEPVRQGLLPELLEEMISPPWDGYDWYVAGPPVMVDKVKHALTQSRVPMRQIFYDSFG